MRPTVVRAALGLVTLFASAGVPLAAQSNLTATVVGPTTVTLKWNAATGSNGYSIQRALGQGSFATLNSAKIPGTTYTDANAPAQSALRYRIRAAYPNRDYTYSGKVDVVTPASGGNTASAPPNSAAGAAAAGGTSQTSAAGQPAASGAAAGGAAAGAPSGGGAPAAGQASTTTAPAAGGKAAASTTAGGGAPAASGASATTALVPTATAAVPSSPTTGVVQLTPLRLAEATPVLTAGPTKLAVAPSAPAATPSTPAAPASPAPAPTPASGRYRVVANGFSVVHESFDDMLSRDGKYDEVYGGFAMFHFDRKTGDLLDRDLRRTKVLGDINNFPDRLRAGTASGSGGLRAGDSYPDAGHARYRGQDGAEPNSQTFPFKVWEGTLTNEADAAVILPTMWEQDNDGSPYDLWFQAEVASASQIWFDPSVQQAAKQTALGVIAPPGSITPNMTPTFGTGAVVASSFFAALGQPWVGALFAGSRDRPIGMVSSGVLPALPRRAIVLTREIIEQALSGSRVLPNPASLAPAEMWLLAYLDVPVGVIPVLLRDGPGQNLQATYVLYLQVERL